MGVCFQASRRMFLLAAVFGSAGACTTTHGASTVQPARFDYNQAINRSEAEQLLLNVVRLRYRDPTTFLALSSVVTQYEFTGRAGLAGSATIAETSSGSVGPSLGLEYRERPTLSYAPLTGEAFAQRLLSPISPQALLLLSQAGWSLERLVICCVDRLNRVTNATTATGPTPRTIPDNSVVRRIAGLLRDLQNQQAIRFTMNRPENDSRAAMHIDREVVANLGLGVAVLEMENALGLTPGLGSYPITATGAATDPTTIDLRGRSLLGVMFAFSHTVRVPEEHLAQGLVTQSDASTVGPESWDEVLGGTFAVHAGTARPDHAFVAVRYRDHWFYIDDGDLQTKTTFLLLNYLLALQSAAAANGAPMLTLPS